MRITYNISLQSAKALECYFSCFRAECCNTAVNPSYAAFPRPQPVCSVPKKTSDCLNWCTSCSPAERFTDWLPVSTFWWATRIYRGGKRQVNFPQFLRRSTKRSTHSIKQNIVSICTGKTRCVWGNIYRMGGHMTAYLIIKKAVRHSHLILKDYFEKITELKTNYSAHSYVKRIQKRRKSHNSLSLN